MFLKFNILQKLIKFIKSVPLETINAMADAFKSIAVFLLGGGFVGAVLGTDNVTYAEAVILVIGGVVLLIVSLLLTTYSAIMKGKPQK